MTPSPNRQAPEVSMLNDDGNQGHRIFKFLLSLSTSTSTSYPPLPLSPCNDALLTPPGPGGTFNTHYFSNCFFHCSESLSRLPRCPRRPVLNSASYDYIDAHGLPVDINEYSWGSYAKKRNTAVRSTGVLHHPRGKYTQLLSRQVVVHHPFQSYYFANILPNRLSALHSRRHASRMAGAVQIQKFVSTGDEHSFYQEAFLGVYN
jgi:hypothetical protein